MPPQTRYAHNKDASIAFQVHGDGPVDLVLVPGFVSNVDHMWEMPVVPRMFDWFATYARLITFDKRGTGCSDPVHEPPSIDQRVDDLRAVMDAAGSERAVLLGISEGGPASILFAARQPERVEKLILYGTCARFTEADDWPHGFPSEIIEQFAEHMARRWGDPDTLPLWAPDGRDDAVLASAWGGYLRHGASPAMGRALLQAIVGIDVRDAARRVDAPTIVIHRAGDGAVPAGVGRDTAALIPGAIWCELPGNDHLIFAGDWRAVCTEIERFVTGRQTTGPPGRALLTILFTDIVDSTARAAELGDAAWREVLAAHRTLAELEIARYGGRLVKLTGDGALAVFDGPAQAVMAARAMQETGQARRIPLRAGVHTGLCEALGDDVGGLAVHIAARICAAAAAGEVLVSSTVREVLTGSDLRFEGRGERELKGVPGEWRLAAVAG